MEQIYRIGIDCGTRMSSQDEGEKEKNLWNRFTGSALTMGMGTSYAKENIILTLFSNQQNNSILP